MFFGFLSRNIIEMVYNEMREVTAQLAIRSSELFSFD